MKSIDTALIGCGYWGTNIANSLLKIKKKIIITDTNKNNSNILKKRFDKNTFVSNYKNILENKKIKNLFFATPPSANFKLIKKAIIYKKNIFIEKPAFRKVSEFKKISKMTKNYKNVIMIGYVYCYNDYINFIKNFIKKNKINNILYLNFQRQNLGPVRNDVNVQYDLATHDLSILLLFFSKHPKLINKVEYKFLKKNISDISNLSFKINNTFIDINSSWLNPDKIRRISVITKKKMLLYNELLSTKKIKIFNKYARYPKIDKFKDSFFKKKAKIYEGNNFSPKIKDNEPLLNELKYFLNCIQKNKKPLTDLSFGQKILEILERV